MKWQIGLFVLLVALATLCGLSRIPDNAPLVQAKRQGWAVIVPLSGRRLVVSAILITEARA